MLSDSVGLFEIMVPVPNDETIDERISVSRLDGTKSISIKSAKIWVIYMLYSITFVPN